MINWANLLHGRTFIDALDLKDANLSLPIDPGNRQGPKFDMTGLSGRYSFTLTFAKSDDDVSAPSIFTALQEQLGLKLESKRIPTRVLVIEHVERPSEN